MSTGIALGIFSFGLVVLAADSGPSDIERNVVILAVGDLQQRSFAHDVEYCGYVGRDLAGNLVLTQVNRGGRNGCTPAPPDQMLELVASVHTHGAYSPEVPAEFPTSLDMDSDAREGVNGYVATPGGRLWYIDSTERVAFQLCGLGCLPQDPDFRAGDDGAIAQRYTYDELVDLESPD